MRPFKRLKKTIMNAIKFVENDLASSTNTAHFKAGDTVTVFYKIKEGDKERVQQYQGTVMQIRNSGAGKTFTVRKMSGNIGVERIFPISSPFIDKIEISKKGSVRRARIFYLRERTGKSARIKEKKRTVTA